MRPSASSKADIPAWRSTFATCQGTSSRCWRELAGRSELLVLGAHHSNRPWETRVGLISQALLRSGHCPVMLVGHLPAQPAAPLSAGTSA